MDNEKQFLEFVGTVSEHTGAFAGKVATIGGKITDFASGSVSAGKEMLGLADKKVKHASEKKSDSAKTSTLKFDLAAARRKLANAEKTQSKLESQLKELKTENHSLVAELDQMRSELSETKSREGAVRARAAALESELDDIRSQLEEAQSNPAKTTTVGSGRSKRVADLESEFAAIQQELEETQKKSEQAQSEFASKLDAIQVENKSLSSDLEKTQSKAKQVQAKLKSQISNLRSDNNSLKFELEKQRTGNNKMLDLEEKLKTQAAQLEADLAATQSELAETQNQAEHSQTELNKQLRNLQAENETLTSELEKARKEADDAGIRADSIEAKIASLESNVADVSLKSEEASEEESDIDIISPQTDYQDEPAVVPTAEGIKPLIEADVSQEELIDADIENIEEPEPEPILESEVEIDVEEIEPEPLLEVELTEPVEVTVEDVQAADFVNAANRIIFTKALSDFASADTFARIDAAKAIGGITHELSARVLVAHIANEKSAMVRQECIKALTTLEMAEGLSAVESALTDETASVRLAAVWGTYRLAGIESLPKLLVMLSDEDASVRRRAVTCIGWLGGQLKTIGDSQLRRVISALIERLDDSADSIRKAALDALQAVTGKKMSTKQISPERLIDQWHSWWKAELLG